LVTRHGVSGRDRTARDGFADVVFVSVSLSDSSWRIPSVPGPADITPFGNSWVNGRYQSAFRPPQVAASNDRNPPFAMFCRRLDQRPLWAGFCRLAFIGNGRTRS